MNNAGAFGIEDYTSVSVQGSDVKDTVENDRCLSNLNRLAVA